MRKYLVAFGVWILLNAVLYLMGSFVAVSFDIREWDEVGRLLCAWVSSAGLVMLVMAALDKT